MKKIFSTIFVMLGFFYLANCLAAEEFQVQIPGRTVNLTYQVIDDNQLLVAAKDAENNPIKGLNVEDFVIQRGIKKVKIQSVESLETSKLVPLNIVLVIDNSYSMKERRAIKPLLAALDEFFKTVRPIDNVHLVVFNKKASIEVKGHDLHAQSFHSGSTPLLKQFITDAFDSGLTDTTFLYEAMVAGIDIIRRMPEEDKKFLVVFSDGQDLNSAFDDDVVASEAEGVSNLEVFCVDYMQGTRTNRFLKTFAENHNGQIWKAKSATELLPIFQAFSSTLLYRYVVTYEVLDPPSGTLTIEPAELNFEMLTLLNGSPIMHQVFFETGMSRISGNYVLFTHKNQTETFHEKNLSDVRKRYQNILNLLGKKLRLEPQQRIRIVGCNSDSGVEKNNLELSRKRAEAVKSYLSEIWGNDASRMKVEARNLPAQPTPEYALGSRAENQRVEIFFDSIRMQADTAGQYVLEGRNTKELKIKPQIVAGYGINSWELTLLAGDQPIKTLSGGQNLEPLYSFSLNELGLEKLKTSCDLEARLKVTDIYDDTYETTTEPCAIRFSKIDLIHELVRPPHGAVVIKPEKLTIEELTTIDSSPLLNFIFFETGEGEIPPRYILFSNQDATKTFDESNLKGTLEKYQHVLNIIGKRLIENPEARIKIVGCNSNRGAERGRKDLSRSRAESVRAYFKYIWGIDSSQITVEARNSPSVASAGSVHAGRQENQRVEIYSDTPDILSTINSTYVQEISDAEQIQILPQIQAGYDLANWTVELSGDGRLIESLKGQGDLQPSFQFNLSTLGLSTIGQYENIGVMIEVVDKKGQAHKAHASSAVRHIKRQERVAQKMGYRVLEKYALILFDFNSAEVKAHNKIVMDRIIERIIEVPGAGVTIVGHTDNIGNELYNLDLSRRRAKAAYDVLLAGGLAERESIVHEGAGAHDPLFDNNLPEGRALNRTVTVTLEYEQTE